VPVANLKAITEAMHSLQVEGVTGYEEAQFILRGMRVASHTSWNMSQSFDKGVEDSRGRGGTWNPRSAIRVLV
jgi:hypothetical protein